MVFYWLPEMWSCVLGYTLFYIFLFSYRPGRFLGREITLFSSWSERIFTIKRTSLYKNLRYLRTTRAQKYVFLLMGVVHLFCLKKMMSLFDFCGYTTQIPWIVQNTNLVPSENHAIKVDNANYNTFSRKLKTKSALLFFYYPHDSNSHSVILPFFRTALAFKVPLCWWPNLQPLKSLIFAYIDCTTSRNICQFLNAEKIPEIRLHPTESVHFDGASCEINKGEQIDSYLNRYFGNNLKET